MIKFVIKGLFVIIIILWLFVYGVGNIVFWLFESQKENCYDDSGDSVVENSSVLFFICLEFGDLC